MFIQRRHLIVLSAFSFLTTIPFPAISQVVVSGNVVTNGNVIINGSSVGNGSWSDKPRRVTLAVGQLSKDEYGKDRFTTGGAAILVKDSSNRIFIATALHVFDNPSEHWAPDTLRIRGWKDEQTSRYKDFGSLLQVRKDGHPLFTASTKFDLAIIPVTQEILNRVADDEQQVVVADAPALGSADDIYDGADVFILGFPALVGEQYQQRALIRSGIIAWTSSLQPSDSEFLVDARIFPGNSGGPVFSSAAGMTRDAGLESGKPIKLLGIVSQTINAKPELALGIRLPKDGMVVGAAGVGVIEPAQALIELMAQVP